MSRMVNSSSAAAVLWLVALYVVYELAVTVWLTVAAVLAIRAWRRAQGGPLFLGGTPSVTVLIAAHNERNFILGTLESIRMRAGMPCSVIVASDGSTDGMNELLRRHFDMVAIGLGVFRARGPFDVSLISMPKVGKGAVLNAALAHAESEVVVTLDADTVLGEGALRALVAPFDDPAVDAATGYLYVRNFASSLLTRFQFTEYLKAFFWRMGLAHQGINLQVSGAFGAFRTQTLRAVGGFAEESLVEDYEVIYRFHDRGRRSGRPYRIIAVPEAAAYTEVPEKLLNFIHQRTRWFTGFLQTLTEHRRMIGSALHGAVGLVMLPIKSVDACLPLWGLLSLALLPWSLAHGQGTLGTFSVAVFLGKWLLDAVLSVAVVRWHASTFPERTVPPLRSQLLAAATESVAFHWLRQVAVIRSYVWFVTRAKRWEQPRWQVLRALEGQALPASSEALELQGRRLGVPIQR